MPPNAKQQKPIFKFVVTPKNIFMQSPKPKRSTVVLIMLALLLVIVLLIAVYEDGLRSKALDLVISIVEAILTFFSAASKNK